MRLLTVRSAVGATPPLFSRAVTRPSMAGTSDSRVLTRPSMDVTVLPRLLKFAMRGVAPVRLAFGPAVAGYLQGRAVAQDGLAGERGLAQDVPDHHRSELCLDQVEDPASFGARGVGKVAGVQGTQIIGAQEAPVRFRFGPAIAPEPQRGLVAEDGVALEGRFQQKVPYDSGGKLLLDQVEDVGAFRARRAHEVAGVRGGLVQEARDGVVDFRLGPPRGPILQERGCEQRVQFRTGTGPRCNRPRGPRCPGHLQSPDPLRPACRSRAAR